MLYLYYKPFLQEEEYCNQGTLMFWACQFHCFRIQIQERQINADPNLKNLPVLALCQIWIWPIQARNLGSVTECTRIITIFEADPPIRTFLLNGKTVQFMIFPIFESVFSGTLQDYRRLRTKVFWIRLNFVFWE